jgi:ureidoglycolate hydrolase
MRVVTRVARPLTAEAFAPFGWLPVPDTDPADGTHTLTYEWSDPHLNVITHAFDEVAHSPSGAARCDRLFRHDSHTQALMSLNVDAVVAVAAAETDFSSGEQLDEIQAFLLRPLNCFVLHQGTWHWGPFPLGPQPVRLLNFQGRGYLADNESVDLPEAVGGSVEVVVEGLPE